MRAFVIVSVSIFGVLLILLILIAALPNTWIPGFDDILPAAIVDRPYYEVPILGALVLFMTGLAVLIAARFGLHRADAVRILVAALLAVAATVLLTNTSLGDSWRIIGSWSIESTALVFILLVSLGSFLWASEIGTTGSRTELGAALLSGAVVSLMVLVLPESVGESQPVEPSDARVDHAAVTNDLRWMDGHGIDLYKAYLPHRDLTGADLDKATLTCANLFASTLLGARLVGASLDYSSLIRATLRSTDLDGSTFQGADLRDADLGGAHLAKPFDYEAFRGVIISMDTHWPAGFDASKIPDAHRVQSPHPTVAIPPGPRCDDNDNNGQQSM